MWWNLWVNVIWVSPMEEDPNWYGGSECFTTVHLFWSHRYTNHADYPHGTIFILSLCTYKFVADCWVNNLQIILQKHHNMARSWPLQPEIRRQGLVILTTATSPSPSPGMNIHCRWNVDETIIFIHLTHTASEIETVNMRNNWRMLLPLCDKDKANRQRNLSFITMFNESIPFERYHHKN